MKSRFVSVVMLVLILAIGPGCVDQLDRDWYALTQSQHQIIMKVAEYERNQMAMLRGVIDRYFELAEEAIVKKEEQAFLDARTGPDGRLYASDDMGNTVAISRSDVEAFARGMADARLTLRLKRQQWDENLKRWEEVIQKLEASSTGTYDTAAEILAAKESAQAILTELVEITTQIGLTSLTFFLAQ